MANKKVTITYNGSQILPQTELTSSTIIYGSTTLASDFVGTKTLNCNGQVMSSNVVVGSKTLNCNGQLMASNVIIVSEEAREPWDTRPVTEAELNLEYTWTEVQ